MFSSILLTAALLSAGPEAEAKCLYVPRSPSLLCATYPSAPGCVPYRVQAKRCLTKPNARHCRCKPAYEFYY